MSTVKLQRSIFMDVGTLSSKLGLDPKFFDRLLEEDDWSSVIKLHALFEAVCNYLLIFHFQEDRLSKVILKLELSNKSTGKIAFLKELGLFGENERRFISSLSELRNQLVHDVSNCSFDLKLLMGTFSDKELKHFTKTFSPFETRTINDLLVGFVEIDEKSMLELMTRAKNEPKLHIWAGAHSVLVSICDMHGYSDYLQWEKARKIVFEDE